jgi:nucleoside-diphosphate-sugar epimerase
LPFFVKILVLGGTGFLGRHLTYHLLERGHEVSVFHRGKRDVSFPRQVVHIHGDRHRLREQASAFAAFSPEVVVDLIAFTEADAQSTIKVFRDKAERLVSASSMDVYQAYGSFRRLESSAPISRPLSEDAPLRTTLFPYRAAAKNKNALWFNYEKILVERIVMQNDSLPAVVLRLPQVFGPHDPQHRLRTYLKRMDAKENIIIGEAKARWRWTRGYVEDIAVGLALAVENRSAVGEIFNIGEKEAEREIDWIKRIGRAAKWQGEIEVVPEDTLPKDLVEPYDWNHDLAGDTRRIRHTLGYRETVSPGEAMERSVRWERSGADD